MTDLSDRPISLWISLVRPAAPDLSRPLRECVERGSIPYSAVTQPAPLASRQGGTLSSTEAAHSTLVSPKETKQDPSAYGAASGSSRTSRN